jgi:hypothetical protein
MIGVDILTGEDGTSVWSGWVCSTETCTATEPLLGEAPVP